MLEWADLPGVKHKAVLMTGYRAIQELTFIEMYSASDIDSSEARLVAAGINKPSLTSFTIHEGSSQTCGSKG